MLVQLTSDIIVDIRPLADRREYDEAEGLQAEVWGPADVVPAHHLIATAHHGGLVLGAFTNGQAEVGNEARPGLVGLSYAFPAHSEAPLSPPQFSCDNDFHHGGLHHDGSKSAASPMERNAVYWYLYSHMLAVRKSYRSLGLGFQLKQAQREWAVENGFRLITWTFDPLEAANARLNIGKLGGIVRRYVPDYYGELRDGLNAGLPTDRFILEWWLDPAAGGHTDAIATAAVDAEVEIPVDFQALKRKDPEQAVRERLRTRAEFSRLFAEGLVVTGFVRRDDKGVYLLQRPLR